MPYLLSFLIACYCLTRIAQAPFTVSAGSGYRGRVVMVSILSAIGGLSVTYFAVQMWDSAERIVQLEEERAGRMAPPKK